MSLDEMQDIAICEDCLEPLQVRMFEGIGKQLYELQLCTNEYCESSIEQEWNSINRTK